MLRPAPRDLVLDPPQSPESTKARELFLRQDKGIRARGHYGDGKKEVVEKTGIKLLDSAIDKQSTPPSGYLTHDSSHVPATSLPRPKPWGYRYDPPCVCVLSLQLHTYTGVVSPDPWSSEGSPCFTPVPWRHHVPTVVLQEEEEEDGRAMFQPVGEAATGSSAECWSPWKHG